MTRKPNLLFIFTDQQRADALGCYGNPLVSTPNLDRLAQGGVLFENAYCAEPLCTPSRSTIMTGLYPHTTGCTANNIRLKRETPTIAEMVSKAYACGYNGKWHLGDEVVPQHGFEDWVSVEDYYRGKRGEVFYSQKEYLSIMSDYHQFLVENGFEPETEWVGAKIFYRDRAARMPEEFTKPRFQADEAVRFLRENKDRPFILYVSFVEPHRPYCSPFDELYPPGELPVDRQFFERPPEDAALIKQLLVDHWMTREELDDEDPSTEAGCRKLRAKYLGMVTLVDRAVGRMLLGLQELGLEEETIVVFTSDHGDLVGDHMLFGKSCMYEEAIKVPLIIRVPWLDIGRRRLWQPVGLIDLVPTLLELLDEPIPGELEGISRLPVLRGEITSVEQDGGDVFVQWNGTDGWPDPEKVDIPSDRWERVDGPWRTVVTAGGWKLNLSPVDQCELYDLNSDPCERDNLFSHPSQRARIQELTGRIRRWQLRTGDTATLPEP